MKRILIIDDDERMRVMIRQMLERAGYTVMDAEDGEIGVRFHRMAPVDLIITDIFMPEKEGLETIRELMRDFPSLKIIAMSGGGTTGTFSYLELARSLGAHRTLAKPFQKSELLAVVGELLTQNDPATG